MNSITQEMKTEAIAIIEAMGPASKTMWHNGNGHNMTTGYQTFVTRPYKFDDRSPDNAPFNITLRARQNTETGRWSFRFSAGIEGLTAKLAETLLQNFADAQKKLANKKRPVKFNFGDDETYDGFADGTTWNGFDNIWLAPEVFKSIRDEMNALNEANVIDVDPETWDIEPDADGLYSLANGFATSIEESPTMLTAIIPDPDRIVGDARKEVHGETPEELARDAREFITTSGYGASAIGALFNVYRDGNLVGTLAYNGTFDWADPLYDPANPYHSIEVETPAEPTDDVDPLDVLAEALEDWREFLNLDDPDFDDTVEQQNRRKRYQRAVDALNDLTPLVAS